MAAAGLQHGPLGKNCLHVCVDMQRLFATGGPWPISWLERILPTMEEAVSKHASETLFTRFIPANRPGEGIGSWPRYYRRWADVTLAMIDPRLVGLVPPLSRFVPPAKVLDKRVYSPWTEGTGGETDVCVLATVLGAIDRGFRVIVVTDAVCGSADETHDALMALYHSRFSEQVEVATMQEVLDAWD
jgi:nicotinamidase-related amidase